MNPELVNIPDTLRQCGGISRTKVYGLFESGELQRVKLGRRTFVTQSSIDRLVAKLIGSVDTPKAG